MVSYPRKPRHKSVFFSGEKLGFVSRGQSKFFSFSLKIRSWLILGKSSTIIQQQTKKHQKMFFNKKFSLLIRAHSILRCFLFSLIESQSHFLFFTFFHQLHVVLFQNEFLYLASLNAKIFHLTWHPRKGNLGASAEVSKIETIKTSFIFIAQDTKPKKSSCGWEMKKWTSLLKRKGKKLSETKASTDT